MSRPTERTFAVVLVALVPFVSYAATPLPTSAQSSPVSIGVVLPATGPFAPGGTAALDALRLAADEVTLGGGVLGHPVRLVVADSQGRPEIARTEALRLVERDRVWAVIGAYLSEETLPVQDVAAAEGILHIVPVAATMEITDRIAGDPRYRFSFRVAYNLAQWAALLSGYLLAQHVHTYAFIGTAIRWNQELARMLHARLADRGLTEVTQNFYSPTSPVVDPVIIALRTLAPDVVVLGDPGRGAIEFAKRARELGLAGRLLSVGGALGDSRVARTLPSGDYLAFQAAAWRGLTPRATRYWAAFETRYHYSPSGYSDTLPYDALTVLVEAARMAGSIDRDRVAGALARGQFPGVSGIYRFDASHQALWGGGGLGGVVVAWVNGEDRVVFPHR